MMAENKENFQNNLTEVTEFLLLGFPDLYTLKIPFFLLLTAIYSATIVGNLLIIALVSSSATLHSPMYMFLTHLSICDIMISSDVTPNTLQIILLGRTAMSFLSCVTQLYLFGALVIMECFLLTAMSYDRYLAICDPLHYSSIMHSRLPHCLVLLAWSVGFGQALVTHIFVLNMNFCGPNVIDHFFCDLGPVLELSCSETTIIQIEVSVFTIVTCFPQILFIAITYICIFRSILHISSVSGRQKVFSTCSSHLSVVCIYYGSLTILYISPSRGYSFNINKILSLVNSAVTPLINSIIYTLRNKDIRVALNKFLVIHVKQ